jgi:hypothetical protein
MFEGIIQGKEHYGYNFPTDFSCKHKKPKAHVEIFISDI